MYLFIRLKMKELYVVHAFFKKLCAIQPNKNNDKYQMMKVG
jgi:hypothetical protein